MERGGTGGLMDTLTLTQDDAPGLRRAVEEGYRAFSGAVVYRGICMDHRPAHNVLDALEAGEPEVTIGYEPWQVMYRDKEEPL